MTVIKVLLLVTFGSVSAPIQLAHYSSMEECVAAARYASEHQDYEAGNGNRGYFTCVPLAVQQ